MADEYIRRDAAMKAVASQYGACRSPAQNRMIDEIRNKIRRMPAADVAEVVRCAGCKYGRRTVNYYTGEQQGGTWCSLHNILNVSQDDFCSYGEYQTNTGGVTK